MPGTGLSSLTDLSSVSDAQIFGVGMLVIAAGLVYTVSQSGKGLASMDNAMYWVAIVLSATFGLHMLGSFEQPSMVYGLAFLVAAALFGSQFMKEYANYKKRGGSPDFPLWPAVGMFITAAWALALLTDFDRNAEYYTVLNIILLVLFAYAGLKEYGRTKSVPVMKMVLTVLLAAFVVMDLKHLI